MNKAIYFLGVGAIKDIAPDASKDKDLVKKALKDFSASRKSWSNNGR